MTNIFDFDAPSNIVETKPELFNNYWKKFTFHKDIINIIHIITLIYWIVLIFYLYSVLVDKNVKVTFSYKNRLGFSIYFIVIALYPIIYILNKLYQNIMHPEKHVDPYYALCVSGPDQLTPQEQSLGAVGKLDYKCLKESSNYNHEFGEMITMRTWYIIHSIFALVLFLFTQNAGKYKNTVVSSQSHFMTKIIQHALFLAMILMSVDIFTEYYYLSTLAKSFFSNILQLAGALTILLVAFILYRLIYIFV
jgi:hypothetical protein